MTLSPYASVWLAQQAAAIATILLFAGFAWHARDDLRLAAVSALTALVLGYWLVPEIDIAIWNGTPAWARLWDPWPRWVTLAALLLIGNREKRRPGLLSIAAAPVLVFATSALAAVVAVAAGLFEQQGRGWLGTATLMFTLVALGTGPAYFEVFHAVGYALPLSLDGMTIATSIVLGSIELCGWLAIFAWVRRPPAALLRSRHMVFAHELTLTFSAGHDVRAIGGAVTLALCGHWEHAGPCRWPHRTHAEAGEGDRVTARVVFSCAEDDEHEVRRRIVHAAKRGWLDGPEGRSDWTLDHEAAASPNAEECAEPPAKREPSIHEA